MAAVQFFLPYDIAIKPTNIGAPGAKLYVYAKDTTTKQPVYATSALTTQLTNPVVADGAGKFPPIYLNNALNYKIVINDKQGANLYTRNPYIPGQAPDSSALAPYQAAAEAAATAAAGSATSAATDATTATTGATTATTQATTATAQASAATTARSGAEAAEDAIAAMIAGYPGSAGQTVPVASRAVMAAISAPSGSTFNYESKYDGDFVWNSGDYSAQVTADPSHAIYVPKTSLTGSAGVWIKRSFGLVPEDIEITVGTAGEFLTLNQALAHLSAYRARYRGEGINARIRILNDGWTMAEQVIANNGVDMGWIEIVSDQAVVTINRASLTRSTTNLGSAWSNVISCTAAFMGANRAVLPRIGCKFSMNTSGASSSQYGAAVQRGAVLIVSPNSGISDCPGLGAWCNLSGQIIAPYSYWSGNGTSLDPYQAGAVRSDQHGFMNLVGAQVVNNPGQGIMVNGASTVSLRAATVSGNGMVGVQTGGCSLVHAREAQILNNGTTGLYASEGSHIRMLSTVITGNGANGILIDSAARVNCAGGVVVSSNTSYGIRCKDRGLFQAQSPTIQTNTVGGIYADGGDFYLSTPTISGHPAGKDMQVNGGRIQLDGTTTTTSGTSTANNIADSNVTAFNVLRAAGGGMISGRGGVSSQKGVATVAAASTTVTVTHGVDPAYGLTLQEISVTPKNWGSASKFWIAAVAGSAATQFTITVDAAPGGTGADFCWFARKTIG